LHGQAGPRAECIGDVCDGKLALRGRACRQVVDERECLAGKRGVAAERAEELDETARTVVR
jgi:hypothetical protein